MNTIKSIKELEALLHSRKTSTYVFDTETNTMFQSSYSMSYPNNKKLLRLHCVGNRITLPSYAAQLNIKSFFKDLMINYPYAECKERQGLFTCHKEVSYHSSLKVYENYRQDNKNFTLYITL